jgi:hypothetical protein
LVELFPTFSERLAARPRTPRDGRWLLDASIYGDRDYESSLSLAFGERALPATIHVALAILVFALAHAVRFGSVREAPPEPLHHQTEAAAAIAALYRRAARPELASAAVASGFAVRARHALGLPDDCDPGELARRAAERASIPKERIVELLGRAAASDAELVRQTQQSLLVERQLDRRAAT